MGLAVKAQECSKATLLWLNRMWEFLEHEEQEALTPTLTILKHAFEMLSFVRQAKITQMAKMEKVMETAYQQARKARMKAAAREKKDASKMPLPQTDSEGVGLNPAAIPVEDLMEQARENLLKLTKDKEAAFSKRLHLGKNPFKKEEE